MAGSSILTEYQVAQDSCVYFLGCFEKPVTIFAQQVRALHLAYGLIQEGKLSDGEKLAIVGGGVAGMTLAAAIATANPKIKITIFEKLSSLLPLQTGSNDRFVHPHLYDWPDAGASKQEADLPIMSWTAGRAGDVAKTLTQSFRSITAGNGVFETEESTVVKVEDHGQMCLVSREKDSHKWMFQACVFAVGFGVELGSVHAQSYWRSSPFSPQFLHGPNNPTLFISGNGDGGLVDFMLGALKGVDHEQILSAFTNAMDMDSVKAAVASIDSTAWSGAVIDIFAQYELALPAIFPEALLRWVMKHLRTPCTIHIHTNEPHLLKKESAILNRLIFWAIIHADQKTHKQIQIHVGGQLLGNPQQDNPIILESGTSISVDYRAIRIGVAKGLLDNFDEHVSKHKALNPRTFKARPTTPIIDTTVEKFWISKVKSIAAPATPALHHSATLTKISLSQTASGVVTWTSNKQPIQVGDCWNNPIYQLHIDLDVPLPDAGSLVGALARLCAHTPATLDGPESAKWAAKWDQIIVDRTGHDFRQMHQLWSCPPISTTMLPPITSDPSSLAELIHRSLDEKLLKLLHEEIHACLDTPNISSVGWEIEENLRKGMWEVWKQWRLQLDSNSNLRRRFLALLVSDADTEQCNDSQLVLLGPELLKSRIRRAAVMALAIGTCQDLAVSIAPNHPGNLVLKGQTGHATGISRINGIDLGSNILSWPWTVSVVMMSELKVIPQFIAQRDERMNRISDIAPRIGNPLSSENPIIIGATSDFRDALKGGGPQLNSHLISIIAERAASDREAR